MTIPDHDDPLAGRHDGLRLDVTLTTDDDGALRCTIHPPDVSADEATTRWLTAEQGSFVDARAIRRAAVDATFLSPSGNPSRMASEPATDGVASDRTAADGFDFFSP